MGGIGVIRGSGVGTVMHIEVSPRGERSFSSRAAAAFLTAYRASNPEDIVQHLPLTFYVNSQGQYVGTVKGKPLQLILASGSADQAGYPGADDGTKANFQRAYLEYIFRFIGFEDVRVLKIEPTAAASQDQIQAMFSAKPVEAKLAGERFASGV